MGQKDIKVFGLQLGCLFYLFLFAAMLLQNHGSAQSFITIGTGTGTTSTSEACPVNIYYRSLHIQYMYTAAEINALGIVGPQLLDSIAFDVVSKPLNNPP